MESYFKMTYDLTQRKYKKCNMKSTNMILAKMKVTIYERLLSVKTNNREKLLQNYQINEKCSKMRDIEILNKKCC
jgi:predicted transglutaminase-like cysteine proteinase